MNYCILIPAYNSSNTISKLVKQLKEGNHKVVVVNDGSSDDTAQLAIQAGAMVISHLRNEGKGAALKTGFDFAISSGYEAVITMDGDGQHDPTDLPRFLEALSVPGIVLVVGSRLMEGSSMPLVRRLTNKFMSKVISIMANHEIPDSQCGFRAIRKEVLEAVELFGKNFDLESELLLASSRLGWKTVSVPIRTIYNSNGSYIRPIMDSARFLKLVLRYIFFPPKRMQNALR